MAINGKSPIDYRNDAQMRSLTRLREIKLNCSFRCVSPKVLGEDIIKKYMWISRVYATNLASFNAIHLHAFYQKRRPILWKLLHTALLRLKTLQMENQFSWIKYALPLRYKFSSTDL